MARCLLDPTINVRQTHYPVIERLVTAGMNAGLDDQTARARAVAWQASAFGIELFGDHLEHAVGLAPGASPAPISLVTDAFLGFDERLDTDDISH